MKASIAAKLAQLTLRLEELNGLLSSETVTANLDNYRKLSREHAEITPVVELYKAYRHTEDDLHTAQELTNDPSMREFAETEIRDARVKLTELEAALQKELLPKDPNDDPCWQMRDADCGICFVDVLPARARRSKRVDAHFGRI